MKKIDDRQRKDWAERGLPVTGAPCEWNSGPRRWTGTYDLEPLAPDTAYGDDFGMPARTRFRFTGQAPAPTLEFEIAIRDKWPELVSFSMNTNVSSGIRTADLRNVHADALVEMVAELTSIRVRQVGESIWQITPPDGAADAIRSATQRGRPRLSDDDIRRAAEVYRDHLPGGRPLEAVRDAFTHKNGDTISARTAARYIERARKAGLLPETTKGKPSA